MPNRLAADTSPYLRQHADNPVDWYPWGGEAQARARREGKPILLSIGYSACHWCHVMAHESSEAGGFFFTSHDHEQLVHRAEVGSDAATPAGCAIAVLAWQRLSALFGEPRYATAAGRTLALYYPTLQPSTGGCAACSRRSPSGCCRHP